MSLHNYINYYGSLYECPYRKRLSDCPVKPMENKSFADKYEWFHSLTTEDQDLMIKYHLNCLAKRAPSNNALCYNEQGINS